MLPLVPLTPFDADALEPLVTEIAQLKLARNAVVLAHNYMTPDITGTVADVIGDSLALARAAVGSTADVIVLAGVHFMAETAKLLNPEKVVLVPDLAAGCSLASSITAGDVAALRRKHPGVPVVAYVNTTAEVKAVVDAVCTSANAVEVVDSFSSPTVALVPDRHLAAYVASMTDKRIISHDGSCIVHERFTAGEVSRWRAQHPDAVVLAHPECPPEVIGAADFTGSTAAMGRFLTDSGASRVMLLTECSMADTLALSHAEVEFVRPCSLCPFMKLITLEKIRDCLRDMSGVVTVDERVAGPAAAVLMAMVR